MKMTEYFVTIAIPKEEPRDTMNKLEETGLLSNIRNIAPTQQSSDGYRFEFGYEEITGVLLASAVVLRQIRLLINELKDKHDDLEFEIKDESKEIRIKGHKETIVIFFKKLKNLLSAS